MDVILLCNNLKMICWWSIPLSLSKYVSNEDNTLFKLILNILAICFLYKQFGKCKHYEGNQCLHETRLFIYYLVSLFYPAQKLLNTFHILDVKMYNV